MSISFEQRGGVAIITLNRPEKYNSFNTEMSQALQAHLDTCATEAGIRCVLLTGAGKGFCAGQDLAEFPDPKAIDFANIVANNYNPIVQKIRALEKPVVAAVNGIAAGAGANLALACDIVIASTSASFIQAFSKISLIPDSGGTWILPRLVGLQRAAALMYTADKVTAEEAVAMGMIYKCFSDATFENESLAFAEKLAAMPTKGIAYTKALLNTSYANTLDEQLEAELKAQVAAGQLSDFAEGVNAFLEKRAASFTGR